MAERGNYQSRPQRRNRTDSRSRRRGGRRRFGGRRRKTCLFCEQKVSSIDYKDVDLLRSFVADRGKIRARRQTGTCAKHQRQLTVAIKRARHLALLPFASLPGRR